jgi:hypothetical protein
MTSSGASVREAVPVDIGELQLRVGRRRIDSHHDLVVET